MSQYTNYNKKKLKYIVPCIFLVHLEANSFQDIFHKLTTKTKTEVSSFDNFSIKNSKNIKKIIPIKDLKQLFKILNIKKDISILKDKKSSKILSDKNINDYTLTYLIYNKVTNKIENIDIGGEYIALIHIKTNSLNDYKKTKKTVGTKEIPWKDIDKFSKKLQKIAQTHLVTFKNIILADQTLFTANTIEELIENAKSFSQDIHNHEINCKPNIKEDNNTTLITNYLETIQKRNNLAYIRRHPDEFTDDIDLATQNKHINRLLRAIEKNDQNLTQLISTHKIEYPKRYNAYTDNMPISIDTINLPAKEIKKRYPKIIEHKKLFLDYDFKLELKNSGKVILLQWIKTVKEDKKVIHQEKNSKILLDSYVNYKGLRAVKIEGLNYGSIKFQTPFDTYEKNQTIAGFGIIEKADCGYTITHVGTLDISCKDIKLKDLDIKFEHEE